jgi:hypothetical protein
MKHAVLKILQETGLALHRQATHAAHNIIHSVLHLLEPPYTTPLTLNVLTQRAKSRELRTAGAKRAKIDLRLMPRASKVLIQRC